MNSTPTYSDFVSETLLKHLKSNGRPSEPSKYASSEALVFLYELYDLVKSDLNRVLNQRIQDRHFIDQRTRACFELNQTLGTDFLNPDYVTALGQEDAQGRIVFGPLDPKFARADKKRKKIAPLPEFLNGPHVTLFGPPDNAKLSVNAMNCFHRRLKGEPPIVTELLANAPSPFWGADDEDSKTPLHRDLIAAGENLSACFDGTLAFIDEKSKKSYTLEKERLAQPIKRIPGLALPCLFHLYEGHPLPLHLYDFALHLFKNWDNPRALAIYIPKLENEEEAAYIRLMIERAEMLIQKRHPEYTLGSVRVMIVLENPRAIFRVHEIMDALHPYFAGASLGWHDYLASTARLFKEDANYRIPVKADPGIVIKYIKASHHLLADVVGSRGGIKIGGMYGILPTEADLASHSFQVTLKGFFKDVLTQLKRALSGFWVAHPDFVRIGLALVEAWRTHKAGDSSKLEALVTSLLDKNHQKAILDFIHTPDITGLDLNNPLYPRSLIVADMKESDFIANNHPDEIRYNAFQCLQYLADWLAGNGCVALPALLEGVPVRVMDDLATTERSRWEVWHEIHHGRFDVHEFLKIAHEELVFIRKDLSNEKKIVQVKWDARTEKWYPVALKLMIQLMTNVKPVEFATELLLPFTLDSIRETSDPWAEAQKICGAKFLLDRDVAAFDQYFSMCGSLPFAKALSGRLSVDLKLAERLIRSFDVEEIKNAASFHGDIGESKKTLDHVASKEQALVLQEDAAVKTELAKLGAEYLKKFRFKFLISAQGKSGKEILVALNARLQGTMEQEIENARTALWEITLKRLKPLSESSVLNRIEALLKKHQIQSAQLSITVDGGNPQSFSLGGATDSTLFEIASLSKSLASAFSIEYFENRAIPLSSKVNALLEKSGSTFRIPSLDPANPQWGDEVTLEDLMGHSALNHHYVEGAPANEILPNVREFLEGNEKYGYQPIGALIEPGTHFKYSGGGFLVLEHLIESLEKRRIPEITHDFFNRLGVTHLTFEQHTQPGFSYAHGYTASGEEIPGTRMLFPAFAAGAMGSAHDVGVFLNHLTEAFHSLSGSGPISHDTAVRMLGRGARRHDRTLAKESFDFMGTSVGLGIFTAEAGANRLAIHQGANDGFRAIFVHCFEGPDRGKGFVIFCNAELNGVLFISEVAQLLLQELQVQGIQYVRFKNGFDASKISQEQVVNLGYKRLIFDAFQPDLPDKITVKGALDPLSSHNLAVGAEVESVTNQMFARAENLLSPHLPVFDPELFGRQGKIMDSWESVRHNLDGRDELVFRLKKPAAISYVSFSTQFHLGNHPEAVKLEGQVAGASQWQVIVAKTKLEGHSHKHIKLSGITPVFEKIRVSIFPDGGLSRLGLYGENLPESEQQKFQPVDITPNVLFLDPIPQSKKPLSPKFTGENPFGLRVVSASNEHYAPASQVISPYPPLHMFDGFESARSRIPGHHEEIMLELGHASKISHIEIDFTYFRNNNPREISIAGNLHGKNANDWIPLVEKTCVKAYAGNRIEFEITHQEPVKQLKFCVFPDGGLNRIRIFRRD